MVFEHCALFKVPKTPLESVRLEVLRKDAEMFSKTVLCAVGTVALIPSPDWNPIAYMLLCAVCAPRYDYMLSSRPRKEVAVGLFAGSGKSTKAEFARLILQSRAAGGHLRAHLVKNTIGVKEYCFDGILGDGRLLTLMDPQGLFKPGTGTPPPPCASVTML